MGRKVQFDVIAAAHATGFERSSQKIYRLADDSKRLGDKANKSARHVSTLAASLAAVAPAAVPIAAGAAAAGASLAALGVTGLLAIGGIKKEMAAGTPVGKQYGATLGVLKGNLAALEQTAAGGVLTGFQSSVRSLQPLMPLVNRDTAQLSSKLGDIASHAMPGIVRLFTVANPLLLDFANDLDRGAVMFERWATSSDGATKFVAYAQAQLPKVEHTLASLATTAGHVAQGLGPLGGIALTEIGAFSKVINAIPVPVLKVAAPAIVATVLAIKGFEVAAKVAPKINLLTGSVKGLAYANAIAGGSSMSLLLGGLGKLGPAAVVAAAGIYGATQAAQDRLGPLAGRGAQVTAGWLDLIARQTHQSVDAITKAVSGTDEQFQKYIGSLSGLSRLTRGILTDMHDKLGKATVATSAFGYASTTLAGSQVKAGVVIDGVTYAIDKQTTASNLLKNSFDRLNGTSLSVEQTQNQFLDTLGQLKKAHDAGTASIAQNSAKGRVNREILVQLITSANDAAQAVADQTAKTHGLNASLAAGRASLINHEDAIRRAAAAAHLDKGQVDALIASLGKVPRNVVTGISVHDTASHQIATIKANLAALKSKQIDITTYVRNVILPTLGKFSVTHDSHRALGGPVFRDVPYIVGERRAELFVPSQNGRILPRVPDGVGSAKTINHVNQYITTSDPNVAAEHAIARLNWMSQTP